MLASARAARMSVSSPRRPSVPSVTQSWAARFRAASGVATRDRPSRAATILSRSFCSSENQLLKSQWIAFESVAPADDFDARWNVSRRLHVHGEPKAIQKLRAQFTLLRIAAADQHEARGMAHAEAFAFDHILA